jgi:cell wall-associated NlpC family hydrolase
MTREAVIEEAMTWLNTPYVHRGRIKGIGVDCAMILADVYEKVGLIDHIDTPEYPQTWHLHRSDERYLAFVKQYGHEVANPEMGDIAMFRFGRCISHAGIVIKWPRIIHAYYKSGVILDDGDQGDMYGRLVCFYSLFKD